MIVDEIVTDALCQAAKNGDIAVCRDLIARGADVRAYASVNAYNDNFAPLHHAAQFGHIEVCRLLIDHGADIHALTKHSGETPLSRAAKGDPMRAEILQLFLELGGDPNLKRTVDQGCPLHQAVKCKQPDATDAIRVLLDHGAEVHALDQLLHTPLHDIAIFDAPVENARVLVGAGADPSFMPDDAKDDYLTPFQAAVRMGSRPIIEYFITECGQDLSQTTRGGKTMFDLTEDDAKNRATLLSVMTELAVRNALPDEGAAPARRRQSEPTGSL